METYVDVLDYLPRRLILNVELGYPDAQLCKGGFEAFPHRHLHWP